jgi:hypothetical protein
MSSEYCSSVCKFIQDHLLTATKYTIDTKGWRVVHCRRLDQHSRRSEGGHDMFWDGSLQGWAAPAALAGAAELLKKLCVTCRVSILGYPYHLLVFTGSCFHREI